MMTRKFWFILAILILMTAAVAGAPAAIKWIEGHVPGRHAK
jgi:hypothetical protein